MKRGKFVDEQILMLKENYRKKTVDYNLLTDEIPLHGYRLRFQWFSLFEDEFRILLPDYFMQLPVQVAKFRYVSVYRPPVIFTSPNYSENFGCHLLEEEENDLDRLLSKMQDAVLRQAPDTIMYDKGTIAPPDMEGRWFEYKNFTIDDETYNIQFLIRSDNYLLAGTFNCMMSLYDEWKPLVLKSLGQIERTGRGKFVDESR